MPDILTLRVSESLPKDVGRGIARIDPEDMKNINAEVGDIIEIEGKRKTVAKLMPTFAKDRGGGAIQIDGIIRSNAKAWIGEKIKIRKVEAKSANMVVLEPAEPLVQKNADPKYVKRLIEGLPVTKEDRIRVNLFGARFQDFAVLDTNPEIALIESSTILKIKEKKGRETVERIPGFISYEDIGGLGKQVQRIREMIELPLKYPEIFERIGIEPPKGVLLRGSPGTGKTLIAKAVANETDAHFSFVSGPEIIGKFYGESESRLRDIFQDAETNAPAIIFIDEIDSIAPKREEVSGEKQVERRVVAQLLALMDGLKPRGQVVVIGATNAPDLLDPALRRPGRFDREIEILIPDRNARLEILNIHARGMPLADDVDLEKLAEITHGFVGADLAALCRESAMVCLRKILPGIDFGKEYIPYETLMELEVTMDDFMEAFKDIEPSAMREVFTEVPDVKWDDVGGLNEIKKKIIEVIEWPIKYPELFKRTNTKPLKGIMLYGAPGTGKTLIAKAIANESGINFISVKGPALISKWVGESEKGVRDAFKKARQASPCLLFFDEIDALAPTRGTSFGDSHVTERVISQMLSEMDGIEELKGVVVLAATNRLDIVDPALLRPGRFDLLFELPAPDGKAREEIFRIHTRGKSLSKDVSLKDLAGITEDFVGAEIESVCRIVSMSAIREFIEGEKGDYSNFEITMRHFMDVIENVKKHRRN